MLQRQHNDDAENGYTTGSDRYRRKSKCIRCNPSGDSFQNATRWLLWVSQFFGIMPLIDIGVGRKSRSQCPSFRWCSPNALYSLLLIVMSSLETCCCVYQVFETGFHFGNIGAVTFYLLAMISRSLCLSLAMRWPRIIREWRNMERIFLELPYSSRLASQHRLTISMSIKANVTFAVFISLGLCK